MNNWNITGSQIDFVERALRTHKKVKSFERERDILFAVERKNSLPKVTFLLVDRYTVSLSDVIAAMDEFPTATCIVAAGNWCGYTKEAKGYGLSNGIGVFNIGEFLGALWQKDPRQYASKDADGLPTYAYRST
jgi:hypothetical protein